MCFLKGLAILHGCRNGLLPFMKVWLFRGKRCVPTKEKHVLRIFLRVVLPLYPVVRGATQKRKNHAMANDRREAVLSCSKIQVPGASCCLPCMRSAVLHGPLKQC